MISEVLRNNHTLTKLDLRGKGRKPERKGK